MRDRLIQSLILLVLFLAAVLVVTWPFKAKAQHSPEHMQGHAQYHDEFYSAWQRPNGLGSCCSDHDCAPIDDKYIRASANKLEVYIVERERWVEVPPELVRPYQAPDMRSHLCHAGITVYCFVFGAGA